MIPVRDIELADCQRAARALLAHGLVTASRPSEREWRNVRRYADPLDDAFRELAGYRVKVTQSAVCLVRRFDSLRPTPVFHTPGRPFDRARYALLVLALATLERAGSQTTLTDLAHGIRRAADKTDGLAFDPTDYPSRLALGHAVRALADLGALSLTDGSLDAWERGNDEAEALYDIDRTICRQVFPLTGQHDGTERSFLYRSSAEGREPERRERRQAVVRRLLEDPVVYLDDLPEEDRVFLVQKGGDVLARVQNLTGARVERRREGVALVDPGRGFTHRAFPKGGSADHAALLLAGRLCQVQNTLPLAESPHLLEPADRLLQRLDPSAAPPLRERGKAPFIPQPQLEALAAELHADIRQALKAEHREDPARFLADALEVLQTYDLVRQTEGGACLQPSLARFREVRIDAAADLKDQLALFGGAP